MFKILSQRKGSSMLLAISLFFLLAVLGISLLNAANSNVRNTRAEYNKEQALLYVSSIFDTVNYMVEEGKFNTGGSLPSNDLSNEDDRLNAEVKDGTGRDIVISVGFDTSGAVVNAEIAVAYEYSDSSGIRHYLVKAVYEKLPGGKYKLSKCKGIVENG